MEKEVVDVAFFARKFSPVGALAYLDAAGEGVVGLCADEVDSKASSPVFAIDRASDQYLLRVGDPRPEHDRAAICRGRLRTLRQEEVGSSLEVVEVEKCVILRRPYRVRQALNGALIGKEVTIDAFKNAFISRFGFGGHVDTPVFNHIDYQVDVAVGAPADISRSHENAEPGVSNVASRVVLYHAKLSIQS